jgi:hypothetical protein
LRCPEPKVEKTKLVIRPLSREKVNHLRPHFFLSALLPKFFSLFKIIILIGMSRLYAQNLFHILKKPSKPLLDPPLPPEYHSLISPAEA